MKKILIRIILLLIMLFPINCVKASEAIIIDCPKEEININEEMSCEIIGEADGSIVAIDGTLKASGAIKIISIEKNPEWQGEISDNRILLYWDKLDQKKVNFATVTLKGTNSFTFSKSKIKMEKSSNSQIKGIELSVNGDAYTLSNVEKNIKVNGNIFPTIIIVVGLIFILLISVLLITKKKK